MHSFKKKYKLTKRKIARESDSFWGNSNGLWAQIQGLPDPQPLTEETVQRHLMDIYESLSRTRRRRSGFTFTGGITAVEQTQRLFEEEVRRQVEEERERRRARMETERLDLTAEWTRVREGYIDHPLTPPEAYRTVPSDRELAQALALQAARPRVNPDDRARGNTPLHVYGTPF